MNQSRFSFKKIPHYVRVVWYRIVRPFVWKNALQAKITSLPLHTFPNAVIPLFFNVEQHSSLKKNLLTLLSREEIEQQAEQAEQHYFSIFSNELREHSQVMDWHKDYASTRHWDNAKPASELDFMLSEQGSDVKYAWELSRCHWFTWLGMAYLFEKQEHNDTTSQERRAQAFKRDVESWCAANPLGIGINWAMPMEVAIRATNWIFATSFFHASPSLDATFWQGFMRVLWQHGKHLEYNLEYVRNNANHFMSNAMGLLVLGAFFMKQEWQQGRNDGKRWFLKGKAFVQKEIMRQFYEDGVNYEKSTSYHRFVTEMCTIAFAAAERVHSPFDAVYIQRFTAAHAYIFAYSRHDGSAPRFGDTDNGRVLRYMASENFNNHLKNIDFEKIFFYTPSNLETLQNNSTQNYYFQHFTSGNYIVWKNHAAHFFADVGDYGMNGWGGHGHNDCLSFELWAFGQSVVIDSGTGFYTSNIAMRNALRSTKAHNTVMVENAEQTEYAGLWRIQRDELSPNVLECSAQEQGLKLVAEHSGYARRFGIRHQRTWTLNASERELTLTILDKLLHVVSPQKQGMKSVSGQVVFILPFETHIAHNSETTLECRLHNVTFTIWNEAGCTLEECPISLFYGDLRKGWRVLIPCGTDYPSSTTLHIQAL
jgi:hypothetical protein